MIHEIGRSERCAAVGTAVIALQGEGPLRDEMSAGQGGAFQAGFFTAKQVGQEGEQMIHTGLARGHIPAFHQRRPVQVNPHHLLDHLGDVGKRLHWHLAHGMEQLFADTITVFFQSCDESHQRDGGFIISGDFGLLHREIHGLIAQSYLA